MQDLWMDQQSIMLTFAGVTGQEPGPSIIRSQIRYFFQPDIAKKLLVDTANRDGLRTR